MLDHMRAALQDEEAGQDVPALDTRALFGISAEDFDDDHDDDDVSPSPTTPNDHLDHFDKPGGNLLHLPHATLTVPDDWLWEHQHTPRHSRA